MQHIMLSLAVFSSLLGVTTAGAGEWTARKLHTLDGFDIPECVVVDAKNKVAYVSNVVAPRKGPGYDRFWGHDGTGFISRIKLPAEVDMVRWQQSSPRLPLHGPKGMCIHGGWLWAADIDHVVRFPLAGGAAEVVAVPGAQALNDMATDGTAAYVTDTKAGKCYRLRDGGKHEEIPVPPGINGITFFRGKMYGASWGEKDVYELDPAGTQPPRPFGLKSHFQTPDGIEVLDDGTFIVSDSEGNQVVTIAPDQRTVRKIIETAAPADIGFDRGRGLLYVPLFFEGRVDVYQLENK